MQQELSSIGPGGWRSRRKAYWVTIILCAAVLASAVVTVVVRQSGPPAGATQQTRYLGVYERANPSSYAGVNAFAANTGVQPDVVMYYSSWLEPFQTTFAATAAAHGAVTLVQINPYDVSIAAIASGRYDGYLNNYAEAVHAYGRPVILSFGHEMNGSWYPWGYRHVSPQTFVAAWRHIVTLFRGLGVRNVTWLWTVNIINTLGGIPSPGSWWPGSSYVNWVGLDGYYYQPSWTFTSLFGPTIAAVRELTSDPMLIAETGASAGTDQSVKISDLFAGIHLYGLLGFVWFDANADQDWRLSNSAAIAAYQEGAKTYRRQMP